MVMDRLAKQQIKRKIMFATETDHEKANSIFRGKTLRDDGIVFVKSSLKGSTGFYVKFKSVYQYPNRLSRGGWRVERTKRSKPNIAAIYFSLFP